VDLNQPCPECFREEDGKWFYPCPSDDCVLHDARLIAAAPDLLAAARCALADLEGIMPEFEPSGDREHPAWQTIKELQAAIKKATQP
jgi:hypothetical protein